METKLQLPNIPNITNIHIIDKTPENIKANQQDRAARLAALPISKLNNITIDAWLDVNLKDIKDVKSILKQLILLTLEQK